jgi:hydroxymethylbilane synthase
MKKIIKIGTRGSQLAIVQAKMVQKALKDLSNTDSELIIIKSKGDIDQDTPVTMLGAGTFTNEINQQVVLKNIDIAVHSCKDLPGNLEDGLEIAAVLERGSYFDVVVYKGSDHFLESPESKAVVATGSPRRRAQWKFRYPNHQFEELRGNIETRLKKLEESTWQGIIMAEAALQRLEIKNVQTKRLISSIPSACQGTIAVVCREDSEWHDKIVLINHATTFEVTKIEREFIKNLPINCDTPLGVLVYANENHFSLKAELFDARYNSRIEIHETCEKNKVQNFGMLSASKFLSIGAGKML